MKLEQYTRRENLIFHRIPETDKESCKEKIKEIITEIGLDANSISFHAVHQLGKKYEGRTRPIIARFISREDHDTIFTRKKLVKQSYPEVYITQD